jgi:hypothetical protein
LGGSAPAPGRIPTPDPVCMKMAASLGTLRARHRRFGSCPFREFCFLTRCQIAVAVASLCSSYSLHQQRIESSSIGSATAPPPQLHPSFGSTIAMARRDARGSPHRSPARVMQSRSPPCRKPTASSCRRASTDIQTMASRSNHSSPHAGSAPAIRLRSTGQHQEHGR